MGLVGDSLFFPLDGKFVYYAKGGGVSGIWRVPVEGGEETQVLKQGRQGFWAVTGQGMCFLNLEATLGPAIEFLSFATGHRSQLRTFPREARFQRDFTVSPDGRWVLYSTRQRNSDIMVVENFR